VSLKAKRLTAQQSHELLTRFYREHGPEAMAASYGRTSPETRISRATRLWSFASEGVIVGWGGCVIDFNDSEDEEAMLSVGVFPEHQRNGYHMAILDWMAQNAKSRGAKQAAMMVLQTNKAHYERTIRHTHNGPWIHAGSIWYPPPGMGYFVLPLTEETNGPTGNSTGRSEYNPEQETTSSCS
jgi:GNAT superfamily N-acetyltransferase